MPVPTVTIPYIAGVSVEVISVALAHRMQRISWMQAIGRSKLVRREPKSESEEEQEEVEELLLKDFLGGRVGWEPILMDLFGPAW